jgi:hypothetical protein
MYLRWVISQIQEQANILHGAILFKILFEEPSSLHVDTHRSEYNSEVIVMIVQDSLTGQLNQATLSADLSCNLKGNDRLDNIHTYIHTCIC